MDAPLDIDIVALVLAMNAIEAALAAPPRVGAPTTDAADRED